MPGFVFSCCRASAVEYDQVSYRDLEESIDTLWCSIGFYDVSIWVHKKKSRKTSLSLRPGAMGTNIKPFSHPSGAV